MTRLIIRRLALLPLLLVGLSLIMFLIGRMVPGDPAVIYAGGPERADPDFVEQIRQEWGLDRPLTTQYGRYLSRLASGDLGWSFSHRDEVADVLRARLPATLELVAAALIVGAPVGFGLGVWSARKQGSAVDSVARTVAISGVSLPIYWVGLMLIFGVSVWLGWLPRAGRLPAFSTFEERTGFLVVDAIVSGQFGALPNILRHLVLPTLTLAIVPAAVLARFTRSSFLDVLSENYIRTARAYGLSERTVTWKLTAKNAVLPLITLLAIIVPGLLVGAVLVESVFSWPGVGTFILEALNSRDFIVVQSVTVIIGVVYILMNLLADVSYAVLDPRTRRT